MKEDQIVIYKDENNAIQMEVRMAGEMIWLNRQQLATLFGRDYKTISKHINNALKEELADEVVVAKFANTTKHGAMECFVLHSSCPQLEPVQFLHKLTPCQVLPLYRCC